MSASEITPRKTWKQDLAPYLQADRGRSFGQIASVLPYLGTWVLAAVVRPDPWLAVALGLVATVFLVRMYSLFHDLTHNSMFESRQANTHSGYLLGFLLFTPTAGGSASTASTTRTPATSTSAGPARSTR